MVAVNDQRFSALINGVMSAPDVRTVLATAVEGIGCFLGASRCLALLLGSNQRRLGSLVEWSTGPTSEEHDQLLIKVTSFIEQAVLQGRGTLDISNTQLNPICYEIRADLAELGVRSVLAVPCCYKGEPNAVIIAFQTDRLRRWFEADISLLSFLAYFVGISVNHHQTLNDYRGQGLPYQQLIEHTEAIFFRTNKSFVLTKACSRALRCFGVDTDLLRKGVRLMDLLHSESASRFQELLRGRSEHSSEFEIELQIRNQSTSEKCWLLLRLVPFYNQNGALQGWSGFGVDITTRREAQLALEKQKKQLLVLGKVSQVIGSSLEAEVIAGEGLSVLGEEIGASAGVCFLFPIDEAGAMRFSSGFGSMTKEGMHPREIDSLRVFCSMVSERGDTLVLSDLDADTKQISELCKSRGIRSIVAVPIGVRRRDIVGVVVFFGGEVGSFDQDDVSLLNLACLQIGVAARQSHTFWAYKKQTQRLESLYRMSHALSTNMLFDEVIRNSFEIMRNELGLRRLWLGLVDESQTRLTGHSAYGSGWKRRLVTVNIDIGQRDNFLGRIIRNRRTEYYSEPSRYFEELGLRRLSKWVGRDPMVFVPLVVRGSVLGVLAVQSSSETRSLDEDEMSLLTSMAAEMAVVLFARRLEEKMFEDERMKTAGLLASGVAHNFNNMLQAIIGQASLLDLQRADDPMVAKAVNLINDSAMRGAGLVRQLLSFTQQDASHKLSCNLNEVIQRNYNGFISELKPQHDLQLELASNLPQTIIDPVQLNRVISVLIVNAGEAMPDGGDIRIKTEVLNIQDNTNPHGIGRGLFVKVSVRDEGVGMSSEVLSHCFDPFFTTKNVDARTGLGLTGSGLGLAVAYVLVRRNGGRIVAESVEGKGSVFSVYLPGVPRVVLTPELEKRGNEQVADTRALAVNRSSEDRPN